MFLVDSNVLFQIQYTYEFHINGIKKKIENDGAL